MLVRVLTLRFDPVLDGFDDAPLRDFLKDKAVLSLREHFFVKHEMPYLAVVVTYDLPRPAAAPATAGSQAPQEGAWRDLVTAEDLPLFNTVRDWRAERSKRDGVPPYVICTNRQAAAMVKARPQSLAKLAEVDGFGKAKLAKYGAELLAILARMPALARPTSAPTDTGGDDGHLSI